MTGANTDGLPDLPRVGCAICRHEGGTLTPVRIAWPGDELVLLVEVRPGVGLGGAASELVIELDRGERVRDRLRQRVDWSRGPARVALWLRWGRRPGAGSRLTCRVALDGRPVGRRTVLLLPDGVDAQGRFPAGDHAAPASEATRLAYGHAFRALLDGDSFGEPAKNER
jgi:hypothetical protein